jgi:uncharacterized membrane protein
MRTLFKLFVLIFISTLLLNCAKEEILHNDNGNPSTDEFYKHSDEDDNTPIMGKAVNSNGEPIASAIVQLFLSEISSILQSTTTNSFGEYVFDNVDDNTYDISITKTNYQLKTIQVTVPYSPVIVDTLTLQ